MEVTTKRQLEESIEIKEPAPDKNYVWDPEDQFILNGRELDVLINNYRRAGVVIEELFRLGISKGIITEAPSPPLQPLVDPTVTDAVPLP
jgi:hypothetical protein